MSIVTNDYLRHYEAEHGRHEYVYNNHALKCHTCKLGFTNSTLYVSHLIGRIQHKRPRKTINTTLRLSNFAHYLTPEEKGFVWTVPEMYVLVNGGVSGQLQQPKFPSNQLLKTAYGNDNGGYYLISFQSSKNKVASFTLENHLKFVRKTIKFLHRTGRIRGHISVVVIATHQTKTKLMPSFFGDLELEVTLISADLPAMKYSAHQMKRLRMYAIKAASATVHLTTHILYAMMHSKTPIIISYGTNGVKSLDTVLSVYGKVNQAVWKYMPCANNAKIEAKEIRKATTFVSTCCRSYSLFKAV